MRVLLQPLCVRQRAYRGESGDLQAIEEANVVRSACDEAFWAVLHKRGLKLEGYELAHAVLVALADADAEARWHCGENVFAAVGTDALGTVGADDALLWQSLWNVAHGDPVPAGRYTARFPAWCR